MQIRNILLKKDDAGQSETPTINRLFRKGLIALVCMLCVVVRCVSSAIAPYYYGVGENHPSGKTNHPLCIAVDQCVARAWASVAVCVCGCW